MVATVAYYDRSTPDEHKVNKQKQGWADVRKQTNEWYLYPAEPLQHTQNTLTDKTTFLLHAVKTTGSRTRFLKLDVYFLLILVIRWGNRTLSNPLHQWEFNINIKIATQKQPSFFPNSHVISHVALLMYHPVLLLPPYNPLPPDLLFILRVRKNVEDSAVTRWGR